MISAYQIAPENQVTVKNLLTAYESESNAHTRHTAYAGEAESDGLPGTASLLRSTARSEEIQATNHAHLIRQLGGEPEAEIQPFEVNNTLENLSAALGEEMYKVDSMYPRFLMENRSADNSAARTLTWALEAGSAIVCLFNKEIRQLRAISADSPAGAPVDFYVRSVCGNVSNTPEPERCWICDRLCSTFETIR